VPSNQTEITPETDPAINEFQTDILFVSDAAKVYQLVSRYSTYFRMAVPIITVLTYFIPLYLEPMMRALKKKFFNRTS
jgi:hypothetical protein